MDGSRSPAGSVRRARWATLASTLLLVTSCGTEAPTDPVDDDPVRGVEAAASIDVVVVLPPDWPNPIYESSPDIVVEASDGGLHRTVAGDGPTSIRLPGVGDYAVGAVVGDDVCFDTAGVARRGNPPITVADGDVIQLRDTGEICD